MRLQDLLERDPDRPLKRGVAPGEPQRGVDRAPALTRPVLKYGDKELELPVLEDRSGPLTLEAWVQPGASLNKLATILTGFVTPRGVGLTIFDHQLELAVSVLDRPYWGTARSGRAVDDLDAVRHGVLHARMPRGSRGARYSAEAEEPSAEDGFTERMKAMIFQRSSSDLMI